MAADERNRERDLVWLASKKHLRCTLKDDLPTTQFGGEGSTGRAGVDDPRLPSTISPGPRGVKESRGEVRLRTRLLGTGGDVAHGAPAPGATDVHSRPLTRAKAPLRESNARTVADSLGLVRRRRATRSSRMNRAPR